jgi:leader peptidase (prepilin peptidase) / N-methyltransferase
MSIASILIAALIGLVIGGISNVLADDLPEHRSPTLPHYPDGTPRPLSAWLGIAAFVLGQRTSPNGAILGWRYPITELLTAGAFVLTVIKSVDILELSGAPAITGLQLVFWLIYMALFVLIGVIDIEHRLILFSVTIPMAVLAILDAALPQSPFKPDLQNAVIGGIVGFVVFFVLYLGGILYAHLRGISDVAFGYGDVILITISGLILGPEALLFAMFITVFLGFAGSMLWIVGRSLRGKGHSLFTALPYGPYIILGTVIMMLYSDEVKRLFGS